MQYHLYLLDAERHIQAEESFSATEDAAAALIAQSVHNACCDVFASFEVWRGPQMVTGGDGKRQTPVLDLQQIERARQESVLELEDRLQRSFACINQSRKIPAATAALSAALRH